jgi:hypothetical protein
MKKMHALEDNILPRVELDLKTCINEHKLHETLPGKYMKDFVKDIVLPMDWTMELDIEDDLENPDDPLAIKRLIYKRSKDSIDENYARACQCV